MRTIEQIKTNSQKLLELYKGLQEQIGIFVEEYLGPNGSEQCSWNYRMRAAQLESAADIVKLLYQWETELYTLEESIAELIEH